MDKEQYKQGLTLLAALVGAADVDGLVVTAVAAIMGVTAEEAYEAAVEAGWWAYEAGFLRQQPADAWLGCDAAEHEDAEWVIGTFQRLATDCTCDA